MIRRFSGAAPVCIVAAFLLLLAGCSGLSTRRAHYVPITAEARAGNYSLAADRFSAARKNFDEKDRLLYYLDAGYLNYFAGNVDSSIHFLQEAERNAEELFTKSVRRAALSLLLNDNVLEYAGEDHEILYANVFASLGYLSKGDAEGALVELRRAQIKLEGLEQKYNEWGRFLRDSARGDTAHVPIDYESKGVRFSNSALTRYLAMHLYAHEGKSDDARIARELYEDAFRAQPQSYPFPAPEVRYQPSPGNGVLSVVSFAGLGPRKEAFALRVRTDKQLGLVQVLYTNSEGGESEYGHLPIPVKDDYYFKFSIPRLEERPSAISKVFVLADGKPVGELSLMEDLTRISRESFEARKWFIYLRSVARAVAKGLIAHRQKSKVKDDGFGGWLKKAMIDVGADLTEASDLRSTQFLPGRALAGDFELPVGTYDIEIEFVDGTGTVVDRSSYPGVTVTPSRFNLVQTFSLK